MKTFIYSIVFALIAFTAIVLSADINCSIENNNGTEATFIPDLKNCSRYYMCANNDPILRECPDNLQFNPKAQVCDFPSAAGCTIKEEENHGNSTNQENHENYGNSTSQENHENHGNSTNQENHGSNDEHPKKKKCWLWIFFCHYE